MAKHGGEPFQRNRTTFISVMDTLRDAITGVWTIKMQSHCCVYPYFACDLHTFSLHNVDIIFRTCIITIQTQGSPEVGPQLAVTSDKGTNYFSVGKQRTEWRDGNSVRADKTQWHLTDSQPPNVLGLLVVKPACCIEEINLSVERYDPYQVTNRSYKCVIQTRPINHAGLVSDKYNGALWQAVFLNPESSPFLWIYMKYSPYSNTGFFHCSSFSLTNPNHNERDFFFLLYEINWADSK